MVSEQLAAKGLEASDLHDGTDRLVLADLPRVRGPAPVRQLRQLVPRISVALLPVSPEPSRPTFPGLQYLTGFSRPPIITAKFVV